MSLIKPITAVAALILLVFSDIDAQQSSAALMNDYFHSSVHRQSIISGREYARPGFYINKGIPYYKTDSLSWGTVMFDNVRHDSVKILYDQIVDELITTDITGRNFIMLVKNRVQYFNLLNDSFVNIAQSGGMIIPGYYQVIYNGKVQMLKSETKRIVDEVKMDDALKKNIESREKIYLKVDGQYYVAANIAAAVNILSNKKAELNSFVKRNRKRYKKTDLDDALKEVLTYYDQLIN